MAGQLAGGLVDSQLARPLARCAVLCLLHVLYVLHVMYMQHFFSMLHLLYMVSMRNSLCIYHIMCMQHTLCMLHMLCTHHVCYPCTEQQSQILESVCVVKTGTRKASAVRETYFLSFLPLGPA